ASARRSYLFHKSAAIAPTTAKARMISAPCGHILILFIMPPDCFRLGQFWRELLVGRTRSAIRRPSRSIANESTCNRSIIAANARIFQRRVNDSCTMRPMTDERRPTLGEEIANSLSHGAGLALAIGGTPVLI